MRRSIIKTKNLIENSILQLKRSSLTTRMWINILVHLTLRRYITCYPSKSNSRNSQENESQDKSRNKHRKELSRKKEKYQEIFPKASKLSEKEILFPRKNT